jgi:hypothetical protein
VIANSTVTVVAAVGSATPFLAVQSSFAQPVSLSGYKVWLGYNYFYSYGDLQQTNCDSVLVGNKFFCSSFNNVLSDLAIIDAQGGTLKAYNNYLNYYAAYG